MSHRVLLCDDEIHIVRAAEFKLARAGIDVRCAGDGEDAWQQVLAWNPDLLVTDCQMPRLDGFGLCARIRALESTRHLPVLMLTAKGYELSHSTAREKFGVIAVLTKPFSPRELLQSVQQVLATGGLELPAPALVLAEQPLAQDARMNLPTEIFGAVVVVHTPEELGADQAAPFCALLQKLERNNVVADLDNTESLDSAGLTALLDAQDELRLQGGDLKIATANATNLKILEITRLDQRLEVFESVVDAVKSFQTN